MSKNIETCKSEEVLSSVLDQQPQDYSSVQQAVHDLGVTALPAASAADPDIEELPSNVDVFVRRVLKAVVYDRVLPVVQQMWQAVLNRILPPNYFIESLRPYASNPSLRTLGTLPTALSAISSRKISNGGATNDGIKDGVSLAHLLMDSTIEVTELKDDNHGWVLRRALPTMPSCKKVTLGCKSIPITGLNPFANLAALEEIYMNELEALDNRTYEGGNNTNMFTGSYKKMEFKGLKTLHCNNMNGQGFFHDITTECELDMSSCEYVYCWATNSYPMTFRNCPGIKKWKLGKLTTATNLLTNGLSGLQDIEFGNGTACNLDLSLWNPTDKGTAFLQNFLHHIAERLAVGPTTNRLTLTLSADVYSACGFGATIDDTTDIRYQIKKAIQDRNWKVTDGTNNFNQ